MNPLDSSAEWGATSSGAVAGAEAFAGGVFGLDSAGCDSGLKWSQSIGRWTRNTELGLLAGLGAFSAPGTGIFYSGGAGYAQYAALDLAESGAGSTIFDTAGGSLLNSLGVENQTAWKAASWFYANSTGSTALAVLGEGGGAAGTAYGSVELPVLLARGVQVTTF